jgi:hypothetical protein
MSVFNVVFHLILEVSSPYGNSQKFRHRFTLIGTDVYVLVSFNFETQYTGS